MSFLKEFWEFLKERKKYWLLPILIVLVLFGILIILSQGSAIMLMNLMASLPKTDGGIMTVAITTTLYRLLMQMDDAKLDNFEKGNAFVNDN